MQQLNFFDHGLDVSLRNKVVAAFELFDGVAARQACQALQDEFPNDATLPPAQVLLTLLDEQPTPPFAQRQAVALRNEWLHQQVAPAASQVLGPELGSAWMQKAWADLAQASLGLPYTRCSDPTQTELHAAVFFLRAKDWQSVSDAVQTVHAWRQIHQPLGWMVQARYHLLGLNATWPMLVELACLAPSRFDEVSSLLGDTVLQRLRKQFDAQFEAEDGLASLQYLPAWALLEYPEWLQYFELAQLRHDDFAAQACQLITQLLRLEKQGRQHDILAARRRLQGVHMGLYKQYMQHRS